MLMVIRCNSIDTQTYKGLWVPAVYIHCSGNTPEGMCASIQLANHSFSLMVSIGVFDFKPAGQFTNVVNRRLPGKRSIIRPPARPPRGSAPRWLHRPRSPTPDPPTPPARPPSRPPARPAVKEGFQYYDQIWKISLPYISRIVETRQKQFSNISRRVENWKTEISNISRIWENEKQLIFQYFQDYRKCRRPQFPIFPG